MRGRFITFEGGEGAGKSTQVKMLRERLEGQGVTTVVTREPGGSPRAEAIRAAVLSGAGKPYGALAEALLFYAARGDHLDYLIRPALARGETVLCDRFSDSTRAYQGAAGSVDPVILRSLDRAVVGDTRPDLTILIDVPADIGLERAAARRAGGAGAATVPDRFEAEDLGFHRRLREAFLSIAHDEPSRCAIINGGGPPDVVGEAVWAAVAERLGFG